MPRWDLVIFDNDGVLVDSEPLANTVLAELLTASGVPTTPEESVARYLGSTIGRVRRLVEAATGTVLPVEFEQRYHDAVHAGMRRGLEPIPGIVDVLDHLDRIGQPYCVASSGSHERIELSLGRTGLLERFGDRRFSAEDVARGKPAPDLFLHAASALGADPGACAVVEDSAAGLVAARAAGMSAFGYVASGGGQADPALADVAFTAMSALPGLLSR